MHVSAPGDDSLCHSSVNVCWMTAKRFEESVELRYANGSPFTIYLSLPGYSATELVTQN